MLTRSLALLLAEPPSPRAAETVRPVPEADLEDGGRGPSAVVLARFLPALDPGVDPEGPAADEVLFLTLLPSNPIPRGLSQASVAALVEGIVVPLGTGPRDSTPSFAVTDDNVGVFDVVGDGGDGNLGGVRF